MLKTAPSSTLVEEFFTDDGRYFFPTSSSILHSELRQKIINEVAPIAGARLVLLLRQALAEWAKKGHGLRKTSP